VPEQRWNEARGDTRGAGLAAGARLAAEWEPGRDLVATGDDGQLTPSKVGVGCHGFAPALWSNNDLGWRLCPEEDAVSDPPSPWSGWGSGGADPSRSGDGVSGGDTTTDVLVERCSTRRCVAAGSNSTRMAWRGTGGVVCDGWAPRPTSPSAPTATRNRVWGERVPRRRMVGEFVPLAPTPGLRESAGDTVAKVGRKPGERGEPHTATSAGGDEAARGVPPSELGEEGPLLTHRPSPESWLCRSSRRERAASSTLCPDPLRGRRLRFGLGGRLCTHSSKSGTVTATTTAATTPLWTMATRTRQQTRRRPAGEGLHGAAAAAAQMRRNLD